MSCNRVNKRSMHSKPDSILHSGNVSNLMHQTFVTTAPRGIVELLIFFTAKPGYMPSAAGTFIWSKLCQTAKSPAGQVIVTLSRPVWA